MTAPLDVPPLYVLADADALGGVARLGPAIEVFAAAGVRWIQVRAKAAADRALCGAIDDAFERLARRGAETATSLWMNDRADLCALFPFRGLHLGQGDLAPADARRFLGPGRWIGLSTHDAAQFEAANADPAVDLVAVGPVYPTTGKAHPDPVVGLDFVRRARAATAKPLVAIGGIDASRVPAVLAAGADAAAVLGAACQGDLADLDAAARRLLAAAGAVEPR